MAALLGSYGQMGGCFTFVGGTMQASSPTNEDCAYCKFVVSYITKPVRGVGDAAPYCRAGRSITIDMLSHSKVSAGCGHPALLVIYGLTAHNKTLCRERS